MYIWRQNYCSLNNQFPLAVISAPGEKFSSDDSASFLHYSGTRSAYYDDGLQVLSTATTPKFTVCGQEISLVTARKSVPYLYTNSNWKDDGAAWINVYKRGYNEIILRPGGYVISSTQELPKDLRLRAQIPGTVTITVNTTLGFNGATNCSGAGFYGIRFVAGVDNAFLVRFDSGCCGVDFIDCRFEGFLITTRKSTGGLYQRCVFASSVLEACGSIFIDCVFTGLSKYGNSNYVIGEPSAFVNCVVDGTDRGFILRSGGHHFTTTTLCNLNLSSNGNEGFLVEDCEVNDVQILHTRFDACESPMIIIWGNEQNGVGASAKNWVVSDLHGHGFILIWPGKLGAVNNFTIQQSYIKGWAKIGINSSVRFDDCICIFDLHPFNQSEVSWLASDYNAGAHAKFFIYMAPVSTNKTIVR